jgi:hypothetical protein
MMSQRGESGIRKEMMKPWRAAGTAPNATVHRQPAQPALPGAHAANAPATMKPIICPTVTKRMVAMISLPRCDAGATSAM